MELCHLISIDHISHPQDETLQTLIDNLLEDHIFTSIQNTLAAGGTMIAKIRFKTLSPSYLSKDMATFAPYLISCHFSGGKNQEHFAFILYAMALQI